MMVVFGVVAWAVFCIRDYCLLATFAAGQKRHVIQWYVASVGTTAAIVALSSRWFSPLSLVIRSPGLLIAAIVAHVVSSAWSVRLGQHAAFGAAWKLALFPPPAAWILLLLSTTAISRDDAVTAALTAAAVAIGSGVLVALAASRFTIEEGSRDDFTFPIRFAACSNCLAICLVPLIAW